jgi:hypothetical protein
MAHSPAPLAGFAENLHADSPVKPVDHLENDEYP